MIVTTIIKSIKDYDDQWFEYELSSLPRWRREKADKIKHSDTRKLSILSGKLLSDVFREYDVDPDNITFNKSGKPMIPGEAPFFFSISHSKNAVAVSISNPNDNSPILPGEDKIDVVDVFKAAAIPPKSSLKSSRGLSFPSIGIDIEYVREYDEKIARRFFTTEEQDYLKVSEDRDEAFTRIWTSKEAYGKFTGTGMEDGLKFSIFHNPAVPLDVILPCCFEHNEKVVSGDRYIYTICYGVIEEI